ncbi:ZIP family metal transporter [Flagellimonas sp. S174]|uniref:ZIP family metal transporter n=1 Tax=Flagellimonas sp. S174 TaxID=3410790 RepID=UPI003BF4893C
MILILPILSVWIGYFLALFLKPKSERGIKLLLAFSGGFLLAFTFFELLPEVYENSNPRGIAIFILLGILIQIFLEFFSKGAEHGHIHLSSQKVSFPTVMFLSLSIHAIIEGIPIREGSSIVYAIIVHKLPVAILLSLFILNSKMKRSTGLLFIGAFSLMTPLGSYIAQYTDWIDAFGTQLVGIAIGVFFHISTIILFESSQEHAFNLRKLVLIALGMGLAYFL